jgi:hypothetical protein
MERTRGPQLPVIQRERILIDVSRLHGMHEQTRTLTLLVGMCIGLQIVTLIRLSTMGGGS